MSGRRSERGLALVVVLWGIAALSLIAAAMLAASVSATHIAHNSWAQIEAQTEADSAVQGAILSLFDPTGGLPIDGRERLSQSGATRIVVTVQDEAGRIDINAAGHDLLRDYFKSAGVDEADTLADRVIDWRSPKGTQSLNGASADDYERAGLPYRPRGAPFQSLDELNLVLGMTPQIFARVAPGLTVYSHRRAFDLRTAPAQVLAVIPGMDRQRAEESVAARPPAGAFAGHAYEIVATVERGGLRVTRRTAILLTRDPARPYWVLDWK